MIDHLAEIHIGSSLERYPDLVLSNAALMQSHLENAAALLGTLKNRLENASATAQDIEMSDESPVLEIFEKLDGVLAQSRSAKVVVGKAIRQVEDLKERSLTLDTSATSVLERTQELTYDFSLAAREFSASALSSLNDTTQDAEAGFSRITTSLSSGPTSASVLFSKAQVATSQMQVFYNLTNNLSQTVEFSSPPPPAPWKVLAQKMREDAADIVARENELIGLRDEVSERKNNLAVKDRMLEELSVRNEVLEKRVGESSSQRERVKELEASAKSFKASEKDYVVKLTRLKDELQSLREEKETWKESMRTLPADGQTAPRATAPSSASSLLHIESLEAEIASLQSTIRYLRTAHHRTFLSTSETYLASPLVPPPPYHHPLEAEAKDVLREMLHLVSQPSSQPVKLRRRAKEDRLQWRPIRETSRWQVQRQKEEWQEWKEWRDGVAQRASLERREEARRRELKEARRKREELDDSMHLPVKVGYGEVKIVGEAETGV